MLGPAILVIRGGAIGDFILTLPVLSALRQQFPAARLEVLGYPRIASLAQEGALADAVSSIEARQLASFFAARGALDPALQDYFGRFAVIISYLYDPDHIFQTNVLASSKAQFIAGGHRPNEQGTMHATEFFLKPLEQLAIYDADTIPHLSLEPLADARSAMLAVHPGSGSEQKNWPEAAWVEFLDDIIARTSWNVLIVGGEAEGARVSRLAGRWPRDRVSVAENLPLPLLARQLKTCRGFIGHDSGITHLAAAVGVPALVLWGESNERIWAPRGQTRILHGGPGLGHLTRGIVFEETCRLFTAEDHSGR